MSAVFTSEFNARHLIYAHGWVGSDKIPFHEVLNLMLEFGEAEVAREEETRSSSDSPEPGTAEGN